MALNYYSQPHIRNQIIDAIRTFDPKSEVVSIDLPNNKVYYTSRIIQHEKIENLTDEELVRAYMLAKLVKEMGYPSDKLELEKTYKIGRKTKQTRAEVDILVKKNSHPFMLIEVKQSDSFERELEGAISTQLFNVAPIEDPEGTSLRYLVYYSVDVSEDKIIEKIYTIDYKKYKKYDYWDRDGRQNLLVIPKEYAVVRKPIFVKGGSPDIRRDVTKKELDGIRTNMHDILWGGGKYQTELFYNLLGLFLAKIYDEKVTTDGKPYHFQIFYKDGEIESPKEVYERVNARYKEALIELLGYTKDDLKKISDIGFDEPKVKYVVDILQGISLTINDYDLLGDFFENIVWGEFKQSKGQYLTHPHIVKFVIQAMELDQLAFKLLNNERRLPYIIDPSCGSGTFLIEAMKLITTHILKNKSKLAKSSLTINFLESKFPQTRPNNWAGDFIHGIENNGNLALAAKVNMVVHGDGSANIEPRDALEGFEKFKKLILKTRSKSEVYEKKVNEQFDAIITNPPFSIKIDRDTAQTLPDNFIGGEKIVENLNKQQKKKEVDVETLFLERWYQLLRPRGRLGAVLPESIFDTTENKKIRLFLYKYFHIRAIVSLPYLTFQPYTATKTSLLFAQKKTEQEVKDFDALWSKYESEFRELKPKVLRLLKNDKQANSELEEYLENNPKKETLGLIKRYLREIFDNRDSELPLSEILKRYEEEIKEVDEDWWIFGEVAKVLDYPIFMAHAEEIGYKRTLRGELQRPNELFQKDQNGQIVIQLEKPNTVLDAFRHSVKWL